MDLACKCCGGKAAPLGLLDFNRTCMDRDGRRVFPPSDTLVPYYACPRCGFVFTDFMDGWDAEAFASRVYNADYRQADPLLMVPGGSAIPKDTLGYHNGLHVAGHLEGAQGQVRILDFGSGGDPGLAGAALIDRGFKVTSYDPYVLLGRPRPTGLYDVIVLIEVIEHCHDLEDVMRQLAAYLAPGGMILVTTGLHPAKPDASVLQSWYIAPRNGHISIFSFPALAILFRRHGLNLVQTLAGMVAFREKPAFPNAYFV